MRIHIAADHAGFETKAQITQALMEDGHTVIDHGAYSYERLDDYPAFCLACSQAVVDDPGSLGVVLGGSGNGEQIAANKVPGARAALAWNIPTAELARTHNNASVVSVGGRMHSPEEAVAIVRAFINADFSNDERHQRRIDQLLSYESTRQIDPELLAGRVVPAPSQD